MSMLEDIQGAMRAQSPSCRLCDLIRDERDQKTKDALRAAAAGMIGYHKLESILKAHETGIGRRTILRHRREKHKP